MALLNIFTSFLSQGWLPNLIGLIGGLLGLWTFIDSYLIKFKPKIYFGTNVIFDTIDNNGLKRLQSIICSLELCNHRKKYGIIYDFAVRIYKADEINPNTAIYYASQIVEKVPMNNEKTENEVFNLFNPITILPNSNRSVNLVLSEVLHRSKLDIVTGSSFYIEIYYQKEPNSNWYFINKLYLFNKNQLNYSNNKYIHFSVLQNDSIREKLNEKVRPQKTSLYTGASQKYISHKIRHYSYIFFKNPFYRIIDVFYSIPFYSHFLIDKLYDKFVKIPIIKRYGKQIEKTNIKIGSPESKPITEAAFEKIYNKLQEFAKQINSGAKKEAMITINRIDNSKIIVERYKLSIKFYIAGDNTIYVQDLYSFNGSRLTYQIDLKNNVWNKKYWYLDNHGFTSINSFVVRVIDAFIIHSNY